MIILRNEKKIIITPFKCGSTSLHDSLGIMPHSSIVMGPCSHYHLEHVDVHTPFIPTLFYGYKRIIACRNPYSRAESMYFQQGAWEERNNLSKIGVDKYIEEKLLVMDVNAPSLLPLSKIYEISEWEEYWKLEEIDRHTKELNIKLPKMNVSKIKTSFTKRQKIRLRSWAEKDCELFNYEVF